MSELPASLRLLREELAALLRQAVPGVNVYPHVPAAPGVPAVVIVPDEPYMEPATIGRDPVRTTVRFRIHCLATLTDNAGGLDRAERMAISVVGALPSGWQVGTVTRPGVTTVGTTDVLETDIQVSTTLQIDVTPIEPDDPEED